MEIPGGDIMVADNILQMITIQSFTAEIKVDDLQFIEGDTQIVGPLVDHSDTLHKPGETLFG